MKAVAWKACFGFHTPRSYKPTPSLHSRQRRLYLFKPAFGASSLGRGAYHMGRGPNSAVRVQIRLGPSLSLFHNQPAIFLKPCVLGAALCHLTDPGSQRRGGCVVRQTEPRPFPFRPAATALHPECYFMRAHRAYLIFLLLHLGRCSLPIVLCQARQSNIFN